MTQKYLRYTLCIVLYTAWLQSVPVDPSIAPAEEKVKVAEQHEQERTLSEFIKELSFATQAQTKTNVLVIPAMLYRVSTMLERVRNGDGSERRNLIDLWACSFDSMQRAVVHLQYLVTLTTRAWAALWVARSFFSYEKMGARLSEKEQSLQKSPYNVTRKEAQDRYVTLEKVNPATTAKDAKKLIIDLKDYAIKQKNMPFVLSLMVLLRKAYQDQRNVEQRLALYQKAPSTPYKNDLNTLIQKIYIFGVEGGYAFFMEKIGAYFSAYRALNTAGFIKKQAEVDKQFASALEQAFNHGSTLEIGVLSRVTIELMQEEKIKKIKGDIAKIQKIFDVINGDKSYTQRDEAFSYLINLIQDREQQASLMRLLAHGPVEAYNVIKTRTGTWLRPTLYSLKRMLPVTWQVRLFNWQDRLLHVLEVWYAQRLKI